MAADQEPLILTEAERKVVLKYRHLRRNRIPGPWSKIYTDDYRRSVVEHLKSHPIRETVAKFGHSASTIRAWVKKLGGGKLDK